VTPRRFALELPVGPGDPSRAVDLLAARAKLSRRSIKDVMAKGGVWLSGPTRRGRRRLRRATTALRPGDLVELFYDEELLAQDPPVARCLARWPRYSVWLKPAGLLAQGTNYGDHCALLRQVERQIRAVHLVHRLDRETAGLMLLAHDAEAAARLSGLLRTGGITKRYRAEVLGDLRGHGGDGGTLDAPLDGKPARTEYRVLQFDPGRNVSLVELVLVTGRTHQIRRHLNAVGHPVMGDPRYGRGNKNRAGLQLVAHALEWTCPFAHEPRRVAVDPDELGCFS
jgi:tRNA pseudouridine32 synthase/23S rRNA pseudouridine746 synthase